MDVTQCFGLSIVDVEQVNADYENLIESGSQSQQWNNGSASKCMFKVLSENNGLITWMLCLIFSNQFG